jgi:hypothetical protein
MISNTPFGSVFTNLSSDKSCLFISLIACLATFTLVSTDWATRELGGNLVMADADVNEDEEAEEAAELVLEDTLDLFGIVAKFNDAIFLL